MATNFGQNWQNTLHSAGWRSGSVRNMAVTIQKYLMANSIYIVCKSQCMSTAVPILFWGV